MFGVPLSQARTVLVYDQNFDGFGVTSSWMVHELYTSAAEALEIQNSLVRLGFKVRVVRYAELDNIDLGGDLRRSEIVVA